MVWRFAIPRVLTWHLFQSVPSQGVSLVNAVSLVCPALSHFHPSAALGTTLELCTVSLNVTLTGPTEQWSPSWGYHQASIALTNSLPDQLIHSTCNPHFPSTVSVMHQKPHYTLETHKEPDEVPGPGCSLSRTEVSSVIDVRDGLQGVKYSTQ